MVLFCRNIYFLWQVGTRCALLEKRYKLLWTFFLFWVTHPLYLGSNVISSTSDFGRFGRFWLTFLKRLILSDFQIVTSKSQWLLPRLIQKNFCERIWFEFWRKKEEPKKHKNGDHSTNEKIQRKECQGKQFSVKLKKIELWIYQGHLLFL